VGSERLHSGIITKPLEDEVDCKTFLIQFLGCGAVRSVRDCVTCETKLLRGTRSRKRSTSVS